MLTDAAVRALKPGDKQYKKYDREGLHIVVTPSGGKLWRMRYKFAGKEQLLSIGPYPKVSLSAARSARDDARVLLREGRNPSATRRLRKLAHASDGGTTLEGIGREWFKLQEPQWVERHAGDVIASLEKHIFPTLGSLPMDDIKPADLIAVLRQIEKQSKETARRVRQRVSAIFVYAISTGRAESDPAAIVQSAMAPMKKGRFPAIIDLDEARAMLAKIDSEPAHPVTKLAIRILALTYVRPGPLATTPWTEWNGLDQSDPLWRIPAARMKLLKDHKEDEARDHFVPLPSQAVKAIDALRELTGRGPYALPNARHAHKPMSENAMSSLLRRLGFEGRHVPHGFRTTFSSIMHERYIQDHAVIELMLAHVQENDVEAAYNRAPYKVRRRELAQIYADLLMKDAMPIADVVAGRRR